MLWPELHTALTAWHATNGNPHVNVELVKLARGGTTGAERFLSAFDRAGQLIEFGPTQNLFTMPNDKRTEDYISGRFG